MESVPVSASSLHPETLPGALSELVLQNGRQKGARRALVSVLTLIGSDPQCEFHLNVEGVEPLHCAIVRSNAGFLLRDLGSSSGSFVNGEAIQECLLQDGDIIAIGPFQFSLQISEQSDSTSSDPRLSERDSLRIQAAAVAAQQAALAEEEAQLQRRHKALVRQKEQLASHLEERRKQLLTLREQARRDRILLKTETEDAKRQIDALRSALNGEREATHKEKQLAEKERRRFIELRKRLKKRWHKHWHAHEAALHRREQEVKAERAAIERDAETLRRERVQLTQAQLRFNGEMELGRRQLHDEWQQLGLAQQQWEACLNHEQMERGHRLRELDRRAAAMSATEQALAEQRRAAEQLQLNLRKEAEGLENRINNRRLKLLEFEKQWNDGIVKRTAEEPAAVVVSRRREPDTPRILERLAGDLADQRRRILEQWQCLLKFHEVWEPERSALLDQFETAARELVLVEQRLQERERLLLVAESDLGRRHQSLVEVRYSLEAWQARLTARETFLDNERVMLLADSKSREEMAEARMQRLEDMRQRRARRRGQEVEEWRVALTQHEQMRRDYSMLWQECQNRRGKLILEQRELAAKALALEQFRQELLGRAADSPEVEKRLQRLYRRHRARLQVEERDLRRERAAVESEAQRLDQRASRLNEQEERNMAQHESWMRQIAEWEDRQEALADLEAQRRQELQHWQLLHEVDQRHLLELREEVERIARLLLEEGDNDAQEPIAA
jgi:pSer/pThr/pTyr-binding forkhead associated (FHA) protein